MRGEGDDGKGRRDSDRRKLSLHGLVLERDQNLHTMTDMSESITLLSLFALKCLFPNGKMYLI